MPLTFINAIQRASRRFDDFLEREGLPKGISASEAHILSYLGVYSPCSVSRIVEELLVKPSTVTSLLKRLEAQSLVRRSRHPLDRRTHVLELTPEGTIAADRIHSLLQVFREEVHTLTSEEEFEGFTMVLKSIDRAAYQLAKKHEIER